jgi:hypothetical protein
MIEIVGPGINNAHSSCNTCNCNCNCNCNYDFVFVSEEFDILHCLDNPHCNLLLKEAQKFITNIDYIIPRPYPPLGTIMALFSQLVCSLF